MTKNDAEASCSFCGKSRDEVSVLIEGQGGAQICEECVVACVGVLKQKGIWPRGPVRLARWLRHSLGHRRGPESG